LPFPLRLAMTEPFAAISIHAFKVCRESNDDDVVR
jgi:hypothetical protein